VRRSYLDGVEEVMKREYWFLAGGIMLGIVLAGAKCSAKFDDSNPECKRFEISTGAERSVSARETTAR